MVEPARRDRRRQTRQASSATTKRPADAAPDGRDRVLERRIPGRHAGSARRAAQRIWFREQPHRVARRFAALSGRGRRGRRWSQSCAAGSIRAPGSHAPSLPRARAAILAAAIAANQPTRTGLLARSVRYSRHAVSRHHGAIAGRRWTQARLRALEGAGWRCGRCGAAGALGGSPPDSAASRRRAVRPREPRRAVCRSCHVAAHRRPLTDAENGMARPGGRHPVAFPANPSSPYLQLTETGASGDSISRSGSGRYETGSPRNGSGWPSYRCSTRSTPRPAPNSTPSRRPPRTLSASYAPLRSPPTTEDRASVVETGAKPEGADRLELRSRASIGRFLLGAAGPASSGGAEAELQAENCGLERRTDPAGDVRARPARPAPPSPRSGRSPRHRAPSA